MGTHFRYPVVLTPEKEDGGFSVSFPDLPEAHTCGDDLADALAMAADCLDVALSGRIEDGLDIPPPSDAKRGQYRVAPPALTAAKAALYLAARQAGLSKVALGERLGLDEKVARRLLDPRHASRIEAVERALAALGHRLVVSSEGPRQAAAAPRAAAARQRDGRRTAHRRRTSLR